MTKRIWVVVWCVYAFIIGAFAHAHAEPSLTTSPARYELQASLGGMPMTIVFRHCNGAEDEMGHLRMVSFDSNRIVYRCKSHGY